MKTVLDRFKEALHDGLEIVLWFTIDTLTKYFQSLSFNKSEENDIVLSQVTALLYYAVEKSRSYGVTEPVINGDLSHEYWDWFNWWKSYIDSLPHQDQHKIAKIMDSVESFKDPQNVAYLKKFYPPALVN